MDINEQKLKELLKEQREEYQRYVGVVFEEFTSQVKLLAEAVAGIQQQLISLREMVAKNTEDIEILKIEVIGMRKDIVEMKKDIEIIKADIAAIKFELKRKVSWDEFEALEKRVLVLEKN